MRRACLYRQFSVYTKEGFREAAREAKEKAEGLSTKKN
jgi:hypothetical protein